MTKLSFTASVLLGVAVCLKGLPEWVQNSARNVRQGSVRRGVVPDIVNDSNVELSALHFARDSLNWTIAAFYDLDGDGTQDILFAQTGGTLRENNNTVGVLALCYNGKLFRPCESNGESRTTISFEKHSAEYQDWTVISILPGDWRQRGEVSFVVILEKERKYRFVFVPCKLGNELKPTWVQPPFEAASIIRPIVIDLNFDGLPDLLYQTETGRAVYAGQANGTFVRYLWEDMHEVIDFANYSKIARLRTTTVRSASMEGSDIVSHAQDFSSHQDSDEEGWLHQWMARIRHALFEGKGKGDVKKSIADFEREYLERHDRDWSDTLLKYVALHSQWIPRPLPLTEPTPIANVPGHGDIDLDGDCMADLVLIVDSPDFEGRLELEVWITEQDAEGVTKRRLWRGQRLLLPPNSQAVTFEDFSSRGGSDLAVLACDSMDTALEANTVVEPLIGASFSCAGSERLFLFKHLQPPLCDDAPGPRCRRLSDLCSSREFAFGGVEQGSRQVGVTVSDLRFEGEGNVRLLGSTRFPPTIQAADVDQDGYLDIVLLSTSPLDPSSVIYRILRNIADNTSPSGDQVEGDSGQLGAAGLWDRNSSIFQNVASYFDRGVHALLAMTEKITGARAHSPDAVTPRRFRAWRTIEIPHQPIYAGGFTDSSAENPGQLSFLAFTPGGQNVSVVHKFVAAKLGSEEGFFLATSLTTQIDQSCAPIDKILYPVSGGVCALTITGLDGIKYFSRRTRHAIDQSNLLQPRRLHIGLGPSSNYIDTVLFGVPYTRNSAPSCFGDAAHTPARSHQLAEFQRKWTAIIPNSELNVRAGNPRWYTNDWALSLSINPGTQAFRIIIGTLATLTIVGLINYTLSKKEQNRLDKEQMGFRRRFLAM